MADLVQRTERERRSARLCNHDRANRNPITGLNCSVLKLAWIDSPQWLGVEPHECEQSCTESQAWLCHLGIQ